MNTESSNSGSWIYYLLIALTFSVGAVLGFSGIDPSRYLPFTESFDGIRRLGALGVAILVLGAVLLGAVRKRVFLLTLIIGLGSAVISFVLGKFQLFQDNPRLLLLIVFVAVGLVGLITHRPDRSED